MRVLMALLTGVAMQLAAHAQNAEQLMERARMGAVLQNADLNGKVSGPGGKTPVALFLKGENIQFQFQQNGQWVPFHMRLGEGKFDLLEIKDGKTLRFPDAKLREAIAGSDITYEDLALRFLYWPKPVIEGEERVGTHSCWKVRVNNPGRDGAYALMYVWIHKEFGAFMKVEGFDRAGRRIKRFEVESVMKLPDGSYTLREMKVSTMDGDRRSSSSKLEFDKPTRRAPLGPR